MRRRIARPVNLAKRIPPGTGALALLCVLVYLYQAALAPEARELFALRWSAIPFEITERDLEPETPGPAALTLFTALFMHFDLIHLAGNLFYLAILGPSVERALGLVSFLGLYVVGGVAAGLLQVLLAPASLIPIVGASGAIAAILAGGFVVHPRLQPRTALFGLWLVQNIILGFRLPHAQDRWLGGPAFWAHAGGIAFGVAWGFGRLIWRRNGLREAK